MSEVSSGPGWAGNNMAVLNYLRVVNADRDEDGRFLLRGNGVMSYMGMQEDNADVVIPSDTEYFINGEPANLALGLRGTSAGLSVYVIC